MNRQVSPFAALTGAEKQIKWLEYQSIRLPYVQGNVDAIATEKEQAIQHGCDHTTEKAQESETVNQSQKKQLPEPPPEIPRLMPNDFQKSRHGQYDAVIARMKQAELQTRRFQIASQTSKQLD